MVLGMEETLIISFIVKRLKRGVLTVDDNQDNELGKYGGEYCVNDEGDLSESGER